MTKLKNVIANPARGAAIRWTPPLLGHPQRDYSSGNALFVMTELLITQKQTSADFSADVFDLKQILFITTSRAGGHTVDCFSVSCHGFPILAVISSFIPRLARARLSTIDV